MGIGGVRMQDRFKFRYYNKNAHKMVEPTNWQNIDGIFECIKQQICYDNDIQPLPYDHIGDGIVFMQCTGLKDKNGKLIYDRDIIRFKDNVTINGSKTHIAVVEYNEAFNAFMYHAECKGLYTVNKAQNGKFDVEVIGNIYENPELLED